MGTSSHNGCCTDISPERSSRSVAFVSERRGGKMNMSSQGLLVVLFVGLVAGWLAGQIVRGTGFGVIGDLIVGILGAFIGSWLLPRMGIHLGTGVLSAIVNATIGAILLLLIVRLFRGGGWGSSWSGGCGEAGGAAAGAGAGNPFPAEHLKCNGRSNSRPTPARWRIAASSQGTFTEIALTDDRELEVSAVNASGREIHRAYVHRR